MKGPGVGLVQAVFVCGRGSEYAVVPCADWDIQA